jgi:probable rRNA maturation factor
MSQQEPRVSLRVEVVKAVAAPLKPRRAREILTISLDQPQVARRAASVARGQTNCSLSLRITGDRELHRLNRRFLNEDRTTDVLSFPSGTADQDGYLGDVALSWPAVQRQAMAYGHSPDAEAGLLCVHGLLHLLGWDHTEPGEERVMTALTLDCLKRSGIRVAAGRL